MQKIDASSYHFFQLDTVVRCLTELGFDQQGSLLEFRRKLGGRLEIEPIAEVCDFMRQLRYDAEWIIYKPRAVGPTMGVAESLGATLLGVQFVRRHAE